MTMTLQILAFKLGLTNRVPFYLYDDPIVETAHLLDFLYQ